MIKLRRCWCGAKMSLELRWNDFEIMVGSFLGDFVIILTSLWDGFGMSLRRVWDQVVIILVCV